MSASTNLPALTLIVTDAVRAQFAPGASPEPVRVRVRGPVLPRTRSAVSAVLRRAALAVDPARPVPRADPA
jgi:hypothetical protein